MQPLLLLLLLNQCYVCLPSCPSCSQSLAWGLGTPTRVHWPRHALSHKKTFVPLIQVLEHGSMLSGLGVGDEILLEKGLIVPQWSSGRGISRTRPLVPQTHSRILMVNRAHPTKGQPGTHKSTVCFSAVAKHISSHAL
jgi:hypothetical protein